MSFSTIIFPDKSSILSVVFNKIINICNVAIKIGGKLKINNKKSDLYLKNRGCEEKITIFAL